MDLLRIEQGTVLLNPEISAKLAEFERIAEDIKNKQNVLKKQILAEMEKHGVLKIETDELVISYVAPYTKETFDSKGFRKANPDLYDEFVKISTVSASVRMGVK